MSNRRTLMAAAAIVLAAVAGFGVFFYVSTADKRAEDKAGLVEALVATADIAKGTTGEQALQAGLVKKAKVARGSIPPSIIGSTDELVGRVASGRIDTKQFITAQTFVSKADGGGGSLADAIASASLVAVTAQVDVERGVANQIAPGDRVDIAVQGVGGTGPAAGAAYVLRSIKVLAVGKAKVGSGVDPGATTLEQANVLTFEVTPEQALTIIDVNQRMYLVLLAPTATTASTPTTTTTPKR